MVLDSAFCTDCAGIDCVQYHDDDDKSNIVISEYVSPFSLGWRFGSFSLPENVFKPCLNASLQRAKDWRYCVMNFTAYHSYFSQG